MKKFGPCKILKKHDSGNAYEVEFPSGINISPMFNIVDLTEYHEGDIEEGPINEQLKILAPTFEKVEIEEILDSHVGRSTRKRQYAKYMVKWRGSLLKIHYGYLRKRLTILVSL